MHPAQGPSIRRKEIQEIRARFENGNCLCVACRGEFIDHDQREAELLYAFHRIDVQVVKTSEPITIKEDVQEEKPAPTPSKEKTVEQPTLKQEPKGNWCIQMMASSKKDAVEKGYTQLKKQYPFIENLPYRIESESDGLTRLKVGAYGTRDKADALCQKVKDSGGTCIVKEK